MHRITFAFSVVSFWIPSPRWISFCVSGRPAVFSSLLRFVFNPARRLHVFATIARPPFYGRLLDSLRFQSYLAWLFF